MSTPTIVTNPKREATAAKIRKYSVERGIARAGWSIREWCARRGFSPNTFYRMPPADRPLTISLGNKVIITEAADREWERNMLDRARAQRIAASQ